MCLQLCLREESQAEWLSWLFEGKKKNLPCPLGVLRGKKDTGACTQIKSISNTVTSEYKYESSLSSGCFVSSNRTCVPCAQLPTRSSPAGSKEPTSSYPVCPWPHTPFWMTGGANLCLPLSCGSSEVCSFKPRATALRFPPLKGQMSGANSS